MIDIGLNHDGYDSCLNSSNIYLGFDYNVTDHSLDYENASGTRSGKRRDS